MFVHDAAARNQAVNCLTVTRLQADYSPRKTHGRICTTSMSNKSDPTNQKPGPLKNESARQRWELFHRAIAHAKQSNVDTLGESDDGCAEAKSPAPYLYVAK